MVVVWIMANTSGVWVNGKEVHPRNCPTNCMHSLPGSGWPGPRVHGRHWETFFSAWQADWDLTIFSMVIESYWAKSQLLRQSISKFSEESPRRSFSTSTELNQSLVLYQLRIISRSEHLGHWLIVKSSSWDSLHNFLWPISLRSKEPLYNIRSLMSYTSFGHQTWLHARAY